MTDQPTDATDSFIPETHTCPWCDGQAWELKTMNRDEEPRLKCTDCNAGFLVSDLPQCLKDAEVEA
jgi:transposase-like protein